MPQRSRRPSVAGVRSAAGRRRPHPAERGTETRGFRPPSAGQARGETDARIDSDEPDFIVVDERVALGPRQRALAATYARWMNQLEVRRSLADLSITSQSQEKWVEKNIERGRPN